MATLSAESAKVYGGKDADGNPIFGKKAAQRSGATLNRYLVALGALFSWARGPFTHTFDHPSCGLFGIRATLTRRYHSQVVDFMARLLA